MNKFLENTITLISAIIIFILSIAWCICDVGFESIIAVFTSLTAIIASLFFKCKKNKNSDSTKILNSKNVNIGDINTKGGDVRIGDNN